MVMAGTNVIVFPGLLEITVRLTQMNVNQNHVRTVELAKMESITTPVTVRWATRVTTVKMLMSALQFLVRTMERVKIITIASPATVQPLHMVNCVKSVSPFSVS